MQFPDEGLSHKFSMEQGLRTLPAVLALIQRKAFECALDSGDD